MKKAIIIAGALLLAASSCTTEKKDQFVLTATELPADLNNSYVYIESGIEGEARDSVQIVDGAFAYKAGVDTMKSYMLVIPALDEFRISFIKENGDFNLVKTTGENVDPYKVQPVDANAQSLNAQLDALGTEMDAKLQPIVAEFRAVSDQLSAEDSKLTADERTALEGKLEALNQQYISTTNDVARNVYEANKGNALGAVAFNLIQFDTEEAFITEYEAATEAVKSNVALKKQYETLKKAASTQVGAKYVDFTMEDGKGASAKLSDYLDGQRYLLVDFWASWCGPCRRAMPHLAELSKKFDGKIRVLSVGTWEKSIEDNDKAKEELKMTWETFFDSKSTGATEYGVTGIPTLLFISPDGEILVRSHSPEDVDAKIKELGL